MTQNKLAHAIAACFFGASITAASAQTQFPGLGKCVLIEDSVQRLACFDATTQSLRPAKTVAKGAGKWKMERTTSKIDDSRTIVASVDANSQIHAWPGKVTKPILVLRCMEGVQSAFFVVGMAADVENDPGVVHIKLRLDQDEAQEWRSTESTDKEALFVSDAKKLMDSIAGKSKLLLGFTPFNSQPVLTSFDIKGVEKAITEIQSTCP